VCVIIDILLDIDFVVAVADEESSTKYTNTNEDLMMEYMVRMEEDKNEHDGADPNEMFTLFL
jgi:hypothetical protein